MSKPRTLGLWIGVVCLVLASAGAAAQTSIQAGALSGPPAPVQPQTKSADTYGTSGVSYVQVPVGAFLPFDSGRSYTTAGYGVFTMGRYATGAASDFNAPLQLPSGALITYLELDYCDSNATPGEDVQATLVVCDWTGVTCTHYPTSGTSLAGFLTSADGLGGCSAVQIDMTGFNLTVDNFQTHYQLDAITTATNGSNAITGMIVGYKLQVSPAPGSATFADVPTSDFGFQYIEALNASGITGGCGSGNYCPDSPVTRRQMAIFIAKALGLQWH